MKEPSLFELSFHCLTPTLITMCTRVLSQDGLITHTNTLVLSDACILTSMLPRNASLHQEILCGGQLFPWPVTKEQERDDPVRWPRALGRMSMY